ncbi:uncharacterized protein EI90DRAFT_1102428 [Cantharellus anzutake]|uniref:uncharacterized protein n=1 Tax=Cantharellus anzutake TaxID=1750568 RepID=UPI001908AD39|nr:uncharacterized protein EI90DRAFT_1102428 [Cantharellus anzutake]KAF8330844.1 hypothetical protein EI90DRAFT_1102428 [Cantharellus anzutake]
MSTQIPDPHDPASASDILMPPRWGENKCELSTFCTGLRHSSLAETTRVTSLRRYAAMGKIKHRFLLLEAIREGIRLCIRLDRYPGGQGNQKLLASTYSPADDSVRLSMIEEALVQKGDNREAVIDFDDPVPLNRFGRVFDVVRNESMFYTITKKNCWFFSSVIQELSILFFGGRFNQGAVLNHPELNKRCRKLIKNKLYDVLHVSTSIRDLESLVLAMHEKSLVGPVLRLLRIMKAQDRLLYCSSLSDSVAMQG